MTHPTPPSASADNEGSCPHDNYPLKYVDSPDKCSYCGKPRYSDEQEDELRAILDDEIWKYTEIPATL